MQRAGERPALLTAEDPKNPEEDQSWVGLVLGEPILVGDLHVSSHGGGNTRGGLPSVGGMPCGHK